MIINDGTIYNFDYITLPSKLKHVFKNTSCSAEYVDVYGKFAYGIKIKAKNACDVDGAVGAAAPIFIAAPLVADLTLDKDTVCVGKQIIATDLSIPGNSIKISPKSCTSEYKRFWSISPQSGWTVQTPSDLGIESNNYSNSQSGAKNLNIIFNTPGLYEINIKDINPTGNGIISCSGDSKTKTICVEDKPIPNFELDKLEGCAPFTPIIKDLSDISKSCRVFRKWEILFNSTPCSASTGNYEFIEGTSASSLVPKIKFNTRGNYTIRLKLANTCDTVKYEQQIKVLGLPIVSIPKLDSICLNTSITPTVTVNLCDNTISGYNWTFNTGIPATSTNQTPGAITYNTEGSKTIQVVINSGCGNVTASQTFYVKPLPPVLNPKINNQSPTVTLCIGDNASFTSASMPRTPAIYNWTGPNGLTKTTQNFSFVASNVNQAGIYKVKGTMDGCAGPEESVELVIKTKPTLSITPSSAEICKNTSTSLVASGTTTNTTSPTWTYTWSPNTSLSATTGATVTANPTSTITYTLTGTDGICSNTNTVLVTVKELPVINNSPASQTICSETATSLVTWTSTMASTYSWSISSNTGSITGATTSGTGNLPVMTLTNPTFVNQTLTYAVIPTSNGCDGSSFEYSIVVKPKPDITISPLTKTTFCGGEKITVPTFTSSVTGATFQWNLKTPNPVPTSISGVTTNQSGVGQMTDLTINNNGSAAIDFTYSVTAASNSCASLGKEFSFSVNPAPSIKDPFSTAQEICSESSSTEVPFSSLTSNVKYVWKITNVPIGLSAPSKLADSTQVLNSFSIPSLQLTNTTANPLFIDIVVKAATMGAATCPGLTKTHRITVIQNRM